MSMYPRVSMLGMLTLLGSLFSVTPVFLLFYIDWGRVKNFNGCLFTHTQWQGFFRQEMMGNFSNRDTDNNKTRGQNLPGSEIPVPLIYCPSLTVLTKAGQFKIRLTSV